MGRRDLAYHWVAHREPALVAHSIGVRKFPIVGLEEVALAGVIRDAPEELHVLTVLVFHDVGHEQRALLAIGPRPDGHPAPDLDALDHDGIGSVAPRLFLHSAAK
jgi:hypothetical protein